jgi:hypothetical protein
MLEHINPADALLIGFLLLVVGAAFLLPRSFAQKLFRMKQAMDRSGGAMVGGVLRVFFFLIVPTALLLAAIIVCFFYPPLALILFAAAFLLWLINRVNVIARSAKERGDWARAQRDFHQLERYSR